MNPALLACLPRWPHYHDIFMSTMTEVRLGDGDYTVNYRLPRHASSSLPFHRVWSSRSWHFPVSRREWMATIVNLNVRGGGWGGSAGFIMAVTGSTGLSPDTVARVQSSSDDDE